MAHVLVVDDDPDVRMLIGELLAVHGFEVELAADAMEAIELLDRGARPNVVVADLLMPGVDGTELLAYMRGHPELAEIPVAIVSGQTRYAPRGYKVFTKPVDARVLVDFVRAPAS